VTDPTPRLVILGFDGLDPALLQQWIAQGRLPSFQALADGGGLRRIRSGGDPPSPVAWAEVVTGRATGLDKAFDFPRRQVEIPPGRVDPASGRFHEGRAVSRLPGKPFWSNLDRAGVRSTLFHVPFSFPLDSLEHGRALSGLTTPDLQLGGPDYTLYTDGASPPATSVQELRFQGSVAESSVDGPWRSEVRALWAAMESRKDDELARLGRAGPDAAMEIRKRLADLDMQMNLLAPQRFASAPMRVEKLAFGAGLEVRVQDQRETLKPGQWSEFFTLEFDPGGGSPVGGLCRFHLAESPEQGLEGEIHLLCTGPAVAPERPLFAVSSPRGLAADLVRRLGPFDTRGWPWPSAALQDGLLSRAAFLADLDETLGRREKRFFNLYERPDWDFFFAVFHETDLIQRLFPAHEDNEITLRLYQRVDRLLGRVMENLPPPPRARIIVLSDHGFPPPCGRADRNSFAQDPPNSPGALLTNRTPAPAEITFADVAPTALAAFGVEPGGSCEGKVF
jgi:hypothetical protein